jgi:hypothetical protein
MIPFFDYVSAGQRILIMGCGGGFDVFAGVPLAFELQGKGCSIVFANLSFSFLNQSGCKKIDDVTWKIDDNAKDMQYFPELWLSEFLSSRNEPAPIYAFQKSGCVPLTNALRSLIKDQNIDRVVLVDGGTDSVIFGDEPGLGTIVEDATSIVAACHATKSEVLLASIGFGIDHFHGISHHSYLENVSQLIRSNGFLGSYSVVSATKSADTFLELVDYANRRQPQYPSIVCNSIASALRGDFGNYHATSRTLGTELFINPLMSQYWTFSANKVVKHMAFAQDLAQTTTFEQASQAIEFHRDKRERRQRVSLPI